LIAGQEILTAELLDLPDKLTPDLLLGDVRSHLFLFSSRLEGIDTIYKDRILAKKDPSVNHNLFSLSRKLGRREAPEKDDREPFLIGLSETLIIGAVSRS
jgi:hypothetical protein